ncbi:MAG: alpha/beta hydrolase [Chloroflexota bacterium]|nr:alpha/beta hydrolase [Chloroflexota bacterium]
MERFTSFDGIEIAYQVWGTGGTLPLIFLHHGFIANANINWVQPGIVAALTNAGRQVVALDARGHGESDKPHDPSFYGEEKMAQDLRQLFDIMRATHVDLVGYSMGAIVSLITASQDEHIRRLVVGGVGAGVVNRGGVNTRTLSGAALADAMHVQDADTITDPTARAFRAYADRVGGDREALAAQAVSRHASHIPLNQIKAPTLLITGDNDQLAARPEILASAISDAQTLLLPGDHLSIVRLPRFASAIVEFLAS